MSSLLLRKPPLFPSNDFRLPKLLPSVFPHFFSVFFSSSFFSFLFVSVLIFLLVCWQRPGWPGCGFWRDPYVWSRHGRCQGGHICSSLSQCGAACGGAWMCGCMDGWLDRHGLLACTLIFVCWCPALVSLSLSLCGLALTSVVFSAESVSPKVGPPVSQKMPFLPSIFPFQPL